MSYPSRLATLDEHGTLIKPVRSRVILLTGQSCFRSSRLSPALVDFLTAVARPGVETLLCGFPYHSAFDCAAPAPNLAAASIRNALQVWWSLVSPGYRRSVARILNGVIGNTRESLCIVTGSCGLQLLATAWPLLNPPAELALRVIAIGPALIHAGALPLDRVFVVQGRGDIWSRLLYRGHVDARCKSGHLDYWTSSEVRDLVAHWMGAA